MSRLHFIRLQPPLVLVCALACASLSQVGDPAGAAAARATDDAEQADGPRDASAIPATGPAARVAAELQDRFHEIWRVAHDSALSAAEKRDRVEALLSSRLDYGALVPAALGDLTERFGPEQREEFAMAYSRYVTSLLVARVARHPEHPVEVRSASYDAKRDLVRLVARGSAAVAGMPGLRDKAPRERIRLDFVLRERGDEWLVAALALNHVDVSRNFRDQFRAVLERSEPAELIAELRQRNARNAEDNPFAEGA